MTDHKASVEDKIDGIKGDLVTLYSKFNQLDDKLDKRIDTTLGRVADSEYSHAIVIGYSILLLTIGWLVG